VTSAKAGNAQTGSLRRPRVLFVINSLAGGGAERVMAMLLAASSSMRRTFDMRLVLLDDEPERYTIPDWITVERLGARGSLIRSALRLRRAVARWRPDVTLSFLTRANLANAFANLGSGRAWVVSERVDTTAHLGAGPRSAIAKMLVAITYRHADRVIAVSSGVAAGLRSTYGVRAERIAVIDNPVDHRALADLRTKPCSEFHISSELIVAAAGRLVPNKNFDMLIRAYAMSRLPGDLVIAGYGPERDRLAETVTALGLDGRVHLPGFVSNPFALFGRADLFVLPSNAEGFPNTLVEAMACGLPVIATNCPSGPSEILAGSPRGAIDGLTVAPHGILVPPGDTASLAEALRKMADPTLRRRLAASARSRSRDFGIEQAAKRYWAVITEALDAHDNAERRRAVQPAAS